MDGCYYGTVVGQSFGWTQIVPTLVTSSLTLLTSVTSQFLFVIFGLYLHAMQTELWVIQNYLKTMRPDPVCQAYHAYAFPSITSFYVAAIIAMIITYSYTHKIIHSWFMWLYIYFIGIVPPVILVFTQYNTTWEVIISMLIGIIVTVCFAVVANVFFKPELPYLLNQFPCSTLGYHDKYFMEPEDLQIYKECKKMFAKNN